MMVMMLMVVHQVIIIMAAPAPAAAVGNVNNYSTQSYKNRVDKLYYVYMMLRHLP